MPNLGSYSMYLEIYTAPVERATVQGLRQPPGRWSSVHGTEVSTGQAHQVE